MTTTTIFTAEQLLADRGCCGARVVVTRPNGDCHGGTLARFDGPGGGLAVVYMTADQSPDGGAARDHTFATIDLWPGQSAKGEIVKVHDALTGQRYGGECR